MRRSSDGLALVLDEHLVHAHLLRREGSVAPVQVQVHLDRTGRTDDLGRDGVHVDLLVENVDLELALERERQRSLKDESYLGHLKHSTHVEQFDLVTKNRMILVQ